MNDLARTEQFEVHGRGQMRVVKPRLARPQGIFIATKKWQTFFNKALQRLQGLAACNWPGKTIERAGVVRQSGCSPVQ